MESKNNHCGIYIHVPFCRKKCLYCNFYSEPKNDEILIQNYVDRVKKDIENTLSKIDNLKIDTIYFGGGTPSYLKPEQVEDLILTIKKLANVQLNCEISLEMNPEDVSKTLELESSGVNRITLGVQTIRKSLHKTIGRATKFCDKTIMDEFFSKGTFSHCVDLIVGIPGQLENELIEDIEVIANYSPNHISTYLLTLEDDTPLSKKVIKDEKFEKNQENLFHVTIESLKKHGYEHYEISNFCKLGFESKHNEKYWKFLPYLSFGPGSHSFYRGKRYKNEMVVKDYILSENVELEYDLRNYNSAVVEFFMTGLRLLKGIDLFDFEKVFEKEIPEIIFKRIYKLQSEKYLILTQDKDNLNIKLSSRGLFFSDYVIFQLLQDLL